MKNCRQFAYVALLEIYKKGAYTDIALNKILTTNKINPVDKGLICELVYGIVRRQRTLDYLISQFSPKKAEDQPLFLRIILQIGLYQLRYLTQIPPSAAVNTSVDLAKINKLGKLSGVVNGILRSYLRQSEVNDPLKLPDSPPERLGIMESFPNWIINNFIEQIGVTESEKLCHWYNQTPSLDLRVNPLKISLDELENKFLEANIKVSRVNSLPQALRLAEGSGNVENFPGFEQGWFSVQDSSAQLVTHFLNPQAGEVVIDACAAPGGKTTHIAELMGDEGEILACDIYPQRLKKLRENCDRLNLHSVKIEIGDSRTLTYDKGDRLLLDVPCSGLGTLHKRPDIRWRQTPAKIQEITQLQQQLLENAAHWVKKNGVLVYATCTINKAENEDIIEKFLSNNPQWEIEKPPSNFPYVNLEESEPWIKIWPHKCNMDGFFMIKLHKKG
jgi:16S rRNA (cytosine967-C5)-methyltransferase